MHTQKQADGFREILKKFLMCVLSSIYLFFQFVVRPQPASLCLKLYNNTKINWIIHNNFD